MAVKSKTGVARVEHKKAKPKLTAQGQGTRSKPNHRRKKRIGQGR